MTWQPELHATYCPQHYPPPEDGGGSSWLCDCSGPLVELRAAGQALIDAAPAFGSNSWAEAYDVWQDVVAEQERLEWEAQERSYSRKPIPEAEWSPAHRVSGAEKETT